jgi:hypothetical protein
MSEAQIRSSIRSGIGAPGTEPGEVPLDEPKSAIQLGDRVGTIAPKIEGEAQENRAHQLAVETAEPGEVTGIDR